MQGCPHPSPARPRSPCSVDTWPGPCGEGVPCRKTCRGPAMVSGCECVWPRSGTRKSHTRTACFGSHSNLRREKTKPGCPVKLALGCQINRYCIQYTYTNKLMCLFNSHLTVCSESYHWLSWAVSWSIPCIKYH